MRPAVGISPSDILEVDLNSIADPIRKVVYGTDVRVNTNYPTRTDPEAEAVDVDKTDIDLLSGSISFFIPFKFANDIKYRMNADCIDDDVERKFAASLNIIVGHGTYADRQKAMITLSDVEQAWEKTVGSTSSIAIRWGAKLQMDDCEAFRCACGPLVFISHDFGGRLAIPIELARKLQAGTEIAEGQRVSIRFAEWARYASTKRKERLRPVNRLSN